MDGDQFYALWNLIWCIGLVVCFGLGAFHGHQR